ncbi:LysR substrate-binding domain-containing protein [Chromobacterium alticapitis]|uniref:LysR family transcriptional regulator n=1 Tax=Chromobacterium alticapitis TaxID=2073169 RepID=A0A2S5DBK1_9NEIS|nr:LysR substrate-binding domain-containing protein [Chromobacterium alticapitis]POZ60465.1 LysR family transcriptional regulator [Chromobacterium alticapitis]
MSSRPLPSLLSLRAFEAAARRLSFSLAADELCVTQSAVSHHIRKLEQDLGAPLFERRVREVALTPRGQDYYRGVAAAFALLQESTARARVEAASEPVTLSLLPAFAAHWLAPMLGAFSQAHPDIALRLQADTALADVANGAADLAIRYGRGGWTGLSVQLLMSEQLAPVCSPSLRASLPAHPQASDLLKLPLLASTWPSFEWEAWARRHGANLQTARPQAFSDYNIALEAAQSNQGVLLGRRHLLARHLSCGALVMAMDSPWLETDDIGWWLVSSKQPSRPSVPALRDWLREAAASWMNSTHP